MLRCRDGSFYTGIAADIESACGSMRPAARPAPNTPAPTRRRRSRLSGRRRITRPPHGSRRSSSSCRGKKKLALVRREVDPESLLAPRLQGNRYTRLPHRAPPRLPCVKAPLPGGNVPKGTKGEKDAGAQRLRGFRRFATAGCLRRPYLFRLAGKDREKKGAGLRLVLPASEYRLEPMF